jgi:hypothetical protein
VADTGHGSILELQLPELSIVRTLKLFSAKDHINTLAMWPPGSPGAPADGPPQLWAVLHGLGKSAVAQVDVPSGNVARRLTKVGNKSHGLSLWKGVIIMLSSGEGRLIRVDPIAAAKEGKSYEPETLWEDPEKTFMKGLTGAWNVCLRAPSGVRSALTCACVSVCVDVWRQ